ncbi:MAG: hypothetical protein M1610_06845 [Nitrospirae bacterium]|nr:hypothetical protein [Nitrospirota bacterium]MDA8214163.1 hypothetical protein [Nitrospiraceae bacterium]MDA8338334.1 hypothetical protein [Nitrospiraceae bacterium]
MKHYRVLFICCIITISTLALWACTLIQTQVRKDFYITKQINYADAFEKGVKACRDIDLEIGLSNKDAGQITCNTTYSTFKPYYELNIFLEKEGGMLKKVDVKAFGGTGGPIPPSESSAVELIQKYFNALKQLGIE